MNKPILPPEIVELIVDHITDHQWLLNCALISRTWVVPCQRALFRGHHLYESPGAIPLLLHLQRYPHLQNFIQRLSIVLPTYYYHIETPAEYLSSLAALFPLTPRLTYLHITFNRFRLWDAHDRQLVETFSAFLQTSASLTDLSIKNLRDETDFQQMFTYLEGTNIRRVSLYAERNQTINPLPVYFFDSTRSVVHLPAIEVLCMELDYCFTLHSALKFWLCQHPAMFPNLRHFEIVVGKASHINRLFRDILQPAALRLESFTLELLYQIDRNLPNDYDASLFEGLPFEHFKLRICDIGTRSLIERRLLNWLSSMFRYLTVSRSTVHFTELTLTFTNLEYALAQWRTLDDYLKAVSTECRALDEALSHPAFSGVRRIHLEDNWKRTLITDQAHPELASVIRRTLPCLASQGVLCFS